MMKNFRKHITLAAAIILLATACEKQDTPDNVLANTPIIIGASEAGTKALLDNGTFSATKAMLSSNDGSFAKDGNRLVIYDYVDNSTEPYFVDQIGPDVPGNNYGFEGVWPFENEPHQWTPGVHKFFGWLAKDANMSTYNTPETFFGTGFTFSEDNKTLTIPAKTIDHTTPQFDFMYSNIVSTEPKNDPVNLQFQHLFTAVSFGFENTSNADVSVYYFSVNIYQDAFATITFGNQPVVEYTRGTSVVQEFRTNNSSTTIGIDDEIPNAFKYSATEQEYLLQWPITRTELSYCNMTITYRQSGKTYNDVSLSFPNIELLPGKKYHFNISFIDKQPIRVNYEVVDWHDIENIVTFE